MTRTVATLLVLGAVSTGCQDNVATPFPMGLEPFEDNPVMLGGDLTDETLHGASKDGSEVKVYGKGYVETSPSRLWALTKQPTAMVARCSTDAQQITDGDEPTYEYSFLVHYTVHNVVTVEWDDQWRYGLVLGTQDDVQLAMVRHQKIQGSDFITTSEGTIEVLATDDPQVSELDFVEHLDAISGGIVEVANGMQDNYNRLVALAHDAPLPACP